MTGRAQWYAAPGEPDRRHRHQPPRCALPGLPGERIPLLIDTDVANEIDDLYAIGLALRSPDRFDIAGFVATHFAAARGRETIAESYAAIREVLEAAQVDYPVAMGGDPLCYPGEPREGGRFLIQTARSWPVRAYPLLPAGTDRLR